MGRRSGLVVSALDWNVGGMWLDPAATLDYNYFVFSFLMVSSRRRSTSVKWQVEKKYRGNNVIQIQFHLARLFCIR